MLALELAPGAETSRIVHAIDEKPTIEMVDFVLKSAGRQPANLERERSAVPIPGMHSNLGVAHHLTPEIGHAETPFVVGKLLVRERLYARVHENRERIVRLVRI